MRRLVKSPPAPKIAIVAGEGRPAERLLATVAAASMEIVVIAFLSRPRRCDEHQSRPKRQVSAFPVEIAASGRSDNVLGHDFVQRASFRRRIDPGVTFNCPALVAMSQRLASFVSPAMISNAVRRSR
jgi:hypothetical protein